MEPVFFDKLIMTQKKKNRNKGYWKAMESYNVYFTHIIIYKNK